MPQRQNRPRPKDIESSIFHTNTEVHDSHRSSLGTPDRATECFTIFGKQDYLNDDGFPLIEDENSKDVLAKIVVVNRGSPRYYIKTDSNGRFFNPFGIDEGRHNKFIHRAGKEQYPFAIVSPKAFKFYLDFLRTKNLAHHRNAERENF